MDSRAELISKLIEAGRRFQEAEQDIVALSAQLAAGNEAKLSKPARAPTRRRGKKPARAPGEPRRMQCPRCGKDVECTSRVGSARPVEHDDPDGVPCRKELS